MDSGKERIEFVAPLPSQSSGGTQVDSDKRRILLSVGAARTSTCWDGSNILTPRRRYEPLVVLHRYCDGRSFPCPRPPSSDGRPPLQRADLPLSVHEVECLRDVPCDNSHHLVPLREVTLKETQRT